MTLDSIVSAIRNAPDLPDAACKGLGRPKNDLFYPRRIGDHGRRHKPELWAEEAKKICAGCPDRVPCLLWALEHDEAGVWGGLTEDERKGMKR